MKKQSQNQRRERAHSTAQLDRQESLSRCDAVAQYILSWINQGLLPMPDMNDVTALIQKRKEVEPLLGDQPAHKGVTAKLKTSNIELAESLLALLGSIDKSNSQQPQQEQEVQPQPQSMLAPGGPPSFLAVSSRSSRPSLRLIPQVPVRDERKKQQRPAKSQAISVGRPLQKRQPRARRSRSKTPESSDVSGSSSDSEGGDEEAIPL